MPTNTTNMTWNDTMHFYVLTINGVKNLLNVNLSTRLGSDTEANIFLQEQSDNVKTWLYGYVRKEYINLLEYQIANNHTVIKPFIEVIEEALKFQVRYAIRTESDLSGEENGNINQIVSPLTKAVLKEYKLATKNIPSQRLDEDLYRADY